MDPKPRILICDDNLAIHEDYRKVLTPVRRANETELAEIERSLFGEASAIASIETAIQYVLESAYQGEQALDMVRKADASGHPYAMVFMDVRMPPGWDGVQTIARIWQEFPYTEMVICTAYSDYSWDEIVEKLGRSDRLLFISKPFDTTSIRQMALTLTKKWQLGQQARSYVARLEQEVKERTYQLQELLEEVKRKNRELQRVALHDSLTELPNRALFNDRLQYSISRATRDKQQFAVMIMDLDRFKEINDVQGHLIGDRVLREVAQRLTVALADNGTVARLGGDEFALIVHAVDREACCSIANNIQTALSPPIVTESASLTIGSSIGIALYPEHGEDDITLLRNADVAMYQAKQAGIGFVMFDIEESNRRSSRLRLIRDLDITIQDQKLTLHYQPIIDIGNKTLLRVEALARWMHPERGFISPDDFIALAEHNGLIVPLTIWVIDTALAQLAQWHQSGHRFGLAVNLSTRNFLDPRLPEKVDAALQHWKIDPHWLSLEVTESITMSDPDRAMEIIHRIDDLGVKISIDDFGTGYSSLAYLKRLPVDEIKIDRSFVVDMDTDHDNAIIVKSTLELAHTLGLKVVAEGIETERVLHMLEALKCDMAQGYFISKPKPSDELTRWLEVSNWVTKPPLTDKKKLGNGYPAPSSRSN